MPLKIAILAGCAALAFALAAPAQDLLITNARIIDGTRTSTVHGPLVDKDGGIISVSSGGATAWLRDHAAQNMRSFVIIDGDLH
jgi:hypothetical protein